MKLGLVTSLLVSAASVVAAGPSPEAVFACPPKTAHVGVWWHWMGAQVSAEGIVKDLDWMVANGINSATIFGMADATTPWAKRIANMPTKVGHPYSDAWWELVKFACAEGKRRGVEIGIHNCPGYTSTGGPWIPSRLAMRELVFNVDDPAAIPLAANAPYPVYNEDRHVFEKPDVPARRTDLQEIAVVRGVRVAHVPMGSYIQPADWANFGLECDKMNPEAVTFHLNAVFDELHRRLGSDLRAAGLTHILLDSYEAGRPTWTPRMREEFRSRRGYDPLDYLPILGGFTNLYTAAECKAFAADFKRTVAELYRDVLFRPMGERVRAEGLEFCCEPYWGPFVPEEAAPHVDRLMTEFWYGEKKRPMWMPPNGDWERLVTPHGAPRTVVEAEAFTGQPKECAFTETPLELKVTGDAMFLAGVNRFILHSVVHQPWGDDVKPGVTMGRWGTHFGRNQVWGESGRRWFAYVMRCQALLQWGRGSAARLDVPFGQRAREQDGERIFFLVNTGSDELPLAIAGTWFDPVSGKVSAPPVTLKPTQSGFLRPGVSPSAAPEAYDATLFVPPTTWAKLLQEDAGEPEDVEWAPAPYPGGQMMLAYPDWFKDGLKARPTKRKYFTTWRY